MKRIITFWLYFGTELVDAVRLPIDASDEDARNKARLNFERCPMYPQTCNGHLAKINKSEVYRAEMEG